MSVNDYADHNARRMDREIERERHVAAILQPPARVEETTVVNEEERFASTSGLYRRIKQIIGVDPA